MKQSQNLRLLEYLQRSPISSFQACIYLRITSLHRRLTDLRKQGVSIDKKWSGKGNKKYYVYSLAQPKKSKNL